MLAGFIHSIVIFHMDILCLSYEEHVFVVSSYLIIKLLELYNESCSLREVVLRGALSKFRTKVS